MSPAETGQDQDQESRLPLWIRVAGRAATEAIARVPGVWSLVRAPMRRFFGNAAAQWDERVRPDESDHLAPLVDAVERLGLSPRRILDVGTGTGAGALWLARRFEQAEVLGIDVAPEMIERARAKVDERVHFEVADVREAASSHRRFDLVVHLNCPVLFDDVAAALDSDGPSSWSQASARGRPSTRRIPRSAAAFGALAWRSSAKGKPAPGPGSRRPEREWLEPVAVSPMDPPTSVSGDRSLARLSLLLRLYGVLWVAFFVFMGFNEVFEVVAHDSTLGSLIMWGHGGRPVVLMLVAINLVIGITLIRSASDPLRHRSAIDLALAINTAHMATMALLAVTEPHELIHLIGDVPAGLIPTVIVLAAWLPVRAKSSSYSPLNSLSCGL